MTSRVGEVLGTDLIAKKKAPLPSEWEQGCPSPNNFDCLQFVSTLELVRAFRDRRRKNWQRRKPWPCFEAKKPNLK